MAGIQEFEYEGKHFFCMDVGGLQIADKDEFRKLVTEAKERIKTHPEHSLYMITDVTNSGFDTEVAAIIGDYASHNTPYVKASAVVGTSTVQTIVLSAIKTITGRDFHIAGSFAEAREWLAQH